MDQMEKLVKNALLDFNLTPLHSIVTGYQITVFRQTTQEFAKNVQSLLK